MFLLCSDSSAKTVFEADVEDCLATWYPDGINDAPCSNSYGLVCEYDIHGAGHVASNSTHAGVVLRGAYIEVGFNGSGSIGIKCVLCDASPAFVCVMLLVAP